MLVDTDLATAEERYPIVLLVGDIPIVREYIQGPLQQMHIKVLVANEGLQGLTLLADENPSVVLLNKCLPHMDGFHICQIIRKNLHYQTLPILLLQEGQNTFDGMRARLAGASAYFTIPEEADKVIEAVRNHLNA